MVEVQALTQAEPVVEPAAARLKGVPVDEKLLKASELRACFLARLRRLVTSPGCLFRGEERMMWLAGAMSMTTGELLGMEDAEEFDRSNRRKWDRLQAVIEQVQHVDQHGGMPSSAEVTAYASTLHRQASKRRAVIRSMNR